MPIEFHKGDEVSNITVADAQSDGLILIGIQRGNELLYHKITHDEARELMCMLFGMAFNEGDQMALNYSGQIVTITKNVKPANNLMKWDFDVPPESTIAEPNRN